MGNVLGPTVWQGQAPLLIANVSGQCKHIQYRPALQLRRSAAQCELLQAKNMINSQQVSSFPHLHIIASLPDVDNSE